MEIMKKETENAILIAISISKEELNETPFSVVTTRLMNEATRGKRSPADVLAALAAMAREMEEEEDRLAALRRHALEQERVMTELRHV